MQLKALQMHTTYLSDLQEAFYSVCGKGIKIISLRETKPTKLFNIPIGLVSDVFDELYYPD